MSHLRLVRPPGPKEPRRNRRRPPLFSPDETLRLRAALRTARSLFGTWSCTADALHISFACVVSAARGRTPFSAELAIRLARALGKPIESLYRSPTDASACPTCGTRRSK